jgi:hypothetical protein
MGLSFYRTFTIAKRNFEAQWPAFLAVEVTVR